MASKNEFNVVLLGRRLPDNENLGLGYLLSALHAAGIQAERVILNSPGDMERAWSVIEDRRPGIVGFSLAEGGSAYLPLAMGELLERRGYTGHVTCGGQFATLARQWLLERYSWLDSVIRFAGEVPIVELSRRIREIKAYAGVPGLTTRAGDGVPAPVLDDTPQRIWPERGVLPEVLGHPMAHMVLSRGCRGRCAYCGPAALLDQEIREGVGAGCTRQELRRHGVGGVKRRDVDDICDEMAHLWHERGVRYFYLVDEHPLPWKEEAALEYLAAWKAGLEARGVGRLGIGTMMRADRVSQSVARAFVDVGLIRAFVGIELATSQEARAFGRARMAERAAELIDTLEGCGVATVSNLMLLHPYSSPSTIRSGIDLLAGLPTGLFETTQMQVYHGTRLHGLMRDEGRLQGNPLRNSYSIEDPVVGRFAEIFTRLRGEAFHDYSVAYSAHDLWLTLALKERLDDAALDNLRRRCRRVSRDVNLLHVDALKRALELAERGVGFAGCTSLVREIRREAALIQDEVDRLGGEVARATDRPVFAPMRAAAAAALQVCLIGMPLTGCGESQPRISGDAGSDAAGDIGDAIADDAGTDPECTHEQLYEIGEEIAGLASEAEPCFSGSILHVDGRYDAIVDVSFSFYYCGPDGFEERLAVREERVEDALLDYEPECQLPDGYVGLGWVEGGDSREYDEMRRRAEDGCWDAWEPGVGCEEAYLYDLMVVVGDDGRVVSVEGRDGCEASVEYTDCILAALDGLTFPCLAGYSICPDYVIIE